MSQSEQLIVCRRCDEHIPLSGESCPRCGTNIRGPVGPLGAVAIGVIIVAVSFVRLSDLLVFLLLGLALVGVGGFLFQDRRNRIRAASSTTPNEES